MYSVHWNNFFIQLSEQNYKYTERCKILRNLRICRYVLKSMLTMSSKYRVKRIFCRGIYLWNIFIKTIFLNVA